MNNQKIIKYAHVWFLAVLIACGIVVIGVKAGIAIDNQNSNQNSNRSKNRNSGATGEQTGMTNMAAQDHNFIMDAAMGGLEEVELGRVAAQKGSSDAVKQFGQRMVDDHSKANTELMSLASSKGITLPTVLDEKHQKDVTKLSALSGAEFDRTYSKMMLSDHTKDVAEFEKQSTKGTDADLKAFASKTLPTLQEHLQMAKALPDNQRTTGNSNANRNSNSNRP